MNLEKYFERLGKTAFDALKSNAKVKRNLYHMEEKRQSSLIVRSFQGWKYWSILDKTLHQYTAFKEKQTLS